MTDKHGEQSIFLDAIDLPVEARAGFLEKACGSNKRLRDEVEALLRAHQQTGDLLDAPDDSSLTFDQIQYEPPGTQIGPYKLLQQLGEGGMGVVYMAEQLEPLERRVALKIIKPGMDTRQVIARFDAERRALAMMDHPNIAHVLDAGTTDGGRPYFAMELVKGLPIIRYCDEHQLTVRQRLELFVTVCQGVQHAHQKGIIHRDIKPSNVMVAEYDDHAVPKIIDFGVAKAIQQRLTEKTIFTQLGQVVGTMEYMSPEQAKLNQLDVDTRTDIYSLGVLLYELLTGETPFERRRLRSAAFDEMLRILREEEPPRPSLRLSSSQSLASIAANRHVEPKKLCTLVRGELDWIVMKALEKGRSRRYATANAFADDVQSYLNDEPVEACPPSNVYRLRKFARRHVVALATSSLILIVLISLAIAAVVSATRYRDLANHNAQLVVEKDNALSSETDAKFAARAAQADAEASRRRETTLRQEADRRARIANALRLATDSRKIMAEFPQRSLLLAAEAVQSTVGVGDPAVPQAKEALLSALSTVGGTPLIGQEGSAISADFSSDGRWLALASQDKTVHLWDMSVGKPSSGPQTLKHDGNLRSVKFSPNSSWLAVRGSAKIYLWEMKTGVPVQRKVLSGDKRAFLNIAFSQDGRWLAAGTTRKPYLWDLRSEKTNAEGQVLDNHGSCNQELAFSPEGKWLAVGNYGGTVSISSTANHGDVVLLKDESKSAVKSIAFSPDGKLLATGSTDAIVRLWNVSSVDPTVKPNLLRGHKTAVLKVAFSPDGKWLGTVSLDSKVRLWNVSEDRIEMRPVVLQGHDSAIASFDFSPDSRALITAGKDKTVRRWNLSSEPPMATVLRGHDQAVQSLSISPDSRWLVTTSSGQNARLWDLQKGQPVASPIVFRNHDAKNSGVAFTSDGRWLVAGATAARIVDPVCLFDLNRKSLADTPIRLKGHLGSVRSTSISPSGRWIATSGSDNSVRLWDLMAADPANGSIVYQSDDVKVYSTSISRDGKWLAAGGTDGIARLWNLNANDPESAPIEFHGHEGSITKTSFSSDTRWLATVGRKKTLLWDLQPNHMRPKPIALIENGEVLRSPHAVVFSPDGRWLATGHYPVRLWDLKSTNPFKDPIKLGQKGDSYPARNTSGTAFGESAYAIAFSRNGRWVATGGRGMSVRLWDLKAPSPNSPAVTLGGHGEVTGLMLVGGSITALAFAPDDKWLVSCGTDRSARLWDLTVENPAASPIVLKHRTAVTSAAFSPDGHWLATGTPRAARLWCYRPEDTVELARTTAGRSLTASEEAYYVKLTSSILPEN